MTDEFARWDSHPKRHTTALSFRPSNKVLNQLFLDVVGYFGWKEFVVLYEDNSSLLRMSELLRGIDNSKFKQVLLERLDWSDENGYR